jgi:hypothetical protein
MDDDCLACDLASGRRPLPGGLIHSTESWLVEHCVGPLGLGDIVTVADQARRLFALSQ